MLKHMKRAILGSRPGTFLCFVPLAPFDGVVWLCAAHHPSPLTTCWLGDVALYGGCQDGRSDGQPPRFALRPYLTHCSPTGGAREKKRPLLCYYLFLIGFFLILVAPNFTAYTFEKHGIVFRRVVFVQRPCPK